MLCFLNSLYSNTTISSTRTRAKIQSRRIMSSRSLISLSNSDADQAKPIPLRVLSALMASLERQASRVSGKFKAKAADSRRLLISVRSRIKRTNYEEENKGLVRRQRQSDEDEEECCAVWRKAILMGDRCQPLDFSGVIFYDQNGKRVDQFPFRSPRNSPMPSYVAAKADKVDEVSCL